MMERLGNKLINVKFVHPGFAATTKKRYSDTTIQRYRNRNLEPEPGTVHNLCKLEHFAPQEIYMILIYRGGRRNSKIV